jgi:hypothetical protein
LVTELFPNKPGDYLLRYQYAEVYGDGIRMFSATITNTNSRRIEATFTYDRGTLDSKYFREVVEDMLNRWE